MGRQTAKDLSRWILSKVTMERKSDRMCYTNTMPINTLKSSHSQHSSNSEGQGRPRVERRNRVVSLLGNFLACSTSLTLFSQDLFSWRLKPTSFSMPCLPDWASIVINYLWPPVSFVFLSEAMIRNIFFSLYCCTTVSFLQCSPGWKIPVGCPPRAPLYPRPIYSHLSQCGRPVVSDW